ncbi:MAG: hypothetical protein IJC72_03590 [Clostridia bacterium]|nr:hypothetical protein [Clostridia bacterium]
MEENKQVEKVTEISIRDIFETLKNNLLLIIITVVIALLCGVFYVSVVKPNYTATEKVAYRAENEFNSTTQNNINAMNAFIGTIVDFCDEGVVIDRANYYYNHYLEEKRNEGEDYTVEDYIASIRIKDPYEHIPVDGNYINKDSIKVVSEITEEDSAKFFFQISYTDPNMDEARDKVKILILAIDVETRSTVVIDGVERSKYFAGVISEIIDLNTISIESDISKVKILLVAALLGVIVAAVIVYMKVAFDKSIRSKEELEEIIGVDLLSYIDKQEVK